LYRDQNKPCGNIPTKEFRALIKSFKDNQDVVEKNIEYKQELQLYKTKSNAKDKAFREHSRVCNALKEYNKALIEAIKKLKPITIKHESTNTSSCGMVQVSDAHFNELISILGNQYDFKIAAKRLKRLAIKVKQYFKPFNIKNIALGFTGDMLNSDRRLDELTNQATNRGNASMLSFFLLQQFILDLNQDFNILIITVSGNESRVDKEQGFSDYVASNNYDITIENMLKIAFKNSNGITFASGDYCEKVVEIAGQNVLFIHGEGLAKGNTQSTIQQKIGAYALKGIIIHYVVYGHVHCPNISNHSARSASLGGSNDYNEKALNLIGRASQNIFVFNNDGTRDAIVVDLQHTDNIEGYEIIKELEAYNAKSAAKCHDNKVIFQVVV
jgi:hypothetical protein